MITRVWWLADTLKSKAINRLWVASISAHQDAYLQQSAQFMVEWYLAEGPLQVVANS